MLELFSRKDDIFEEETICPRVPIPLGDEVSSLSTILLTFKEAAEYSNIGINEIDRMLRTPNGPFVLFLGTKKLVRSAVPKNL